MRLAKKIYFILLFYFIAYQSFSQNVAIKGSAKTYEGKAITAFCYDDLISYKEKKFTSALIDSSGNFYLSFNVATTKYVFLKIDKQKADLYVEPFSKYEVIFLPRDTTTYVNSETEEIVDLGILNTDSNELNFLIGDFNHNFDLFWINNYEFFIRNSPQTKIDSFKTALHKRYTGNINKFFLNTIDYKIATLEEKTFANKKKLAQKYLLNKPVDYENYEYMRFFNSFFNHYLEHYALTNKGAGVPKQVNENASFTGLLAICSKDTLLKNDTLKKLVILKGLAQLYYTANYKKDNIIAILEQFLAQDTNKAFIQIANNILYSFFKLEAGTKAPDFKLLNQNNDTLALSDFKGKYLYINFWASTCISCLQEMRIMQTFQKKYGEKIQFISICVDKDSSILKDFILQHKAYNWIFLNAGTSNIKEDYGLKIIPTYFLINPQGFFVQAPADKPNENIEETFYSITKAKKGIKNKY